MTDKIALTPSELLQVSQGLSFLSDKLSAAQATIATGILEPRLVITEPSRLKEKSLHVGTTGSSGTTTVVVRKNGTAITGVTGSIAATAADGSTLIVGAEEDLEEGDILDFQVTAAPGSSSGLLLSANLTTVKRFTI